MPCATMAMGTPADHLNSHFLTQLIIRGEEMYNELSALTRAMQSMGTANWSQVVMAAIVILIPVLFWSRVSSPGMLRAAGILIALSFLLPPVFELILSASTPVPTRRGGGGSSASSLLMLLRLVSAVRPICIGLGMLFAFLSVFPSNSMSGTSNGSMAGSPPSYGEGTPQRPQPFQQNPPTPTQIPPNPTTDSPGTMDS